MGRTAFARPLVVLFVGALAPGCAPRQPATAVGSPSSAPHAPAPNGQPPVDGAERFEELPEAALLVEGPPLPLEGFSDSAHHYRNRHGNDYACYSPTQTVGIAENIVLHQRDNGGWPSNWDPQRILTADEKLALRGEKPKLDTSFDNHTTFTHVEYLAGIYRTTGAERYREACLRGFEFMLQAQHPKGGFPHSYPGSLDYHLHITFMDDVTVGALAVLRNAGEGTPPYDFLDPALRERIRQGAALGERGLLELQVSVGGEPTAWAGQYDERTLQPTSARSYELPALVSRESVEVVEFLMGIESPTEPVRGSIEHAVGWFEKVKIRGLRIEEFPAEPVVFEFHTSTTDRRAVSDPNAPPIWARFYEIGSNRPFLANRDGAKVFTLAEVARERRTGYSWYGYYAKRLLERDYPAWRKRWAAAP